MSVQFPTDDDGKAQGPPHPGRRGPLALAQVSTSPACKLTVPTWTRTLGVPRYEGDVKALKKLLLLNSALGSSQLPSAAATPLPDPGPRQEESGPRSLPWAGGRATVSQRPRCLSGKRRHVLEGHPPGPEAEAGRGRGPRGPGAWSCVAPAPGVDAACWSSGLRPQDT